MRAAGRNLREIAPGLATLLVLEDVPEMDRAASPVVDTVTHDSRGSRVTDAAIDDRDRHPRPSCASTFPAPAAAIGRAGDDDRRASRWSTIDRPEALNALSFDLLDELADASRRSTAIPPCRAIVLTGAGTRAFAAGADIKELAHADVGIACAPAAGSTRGTGWPRSGCRSSPRSAGSPSAAAASSR